jgi:flagellar hook-length control protein FliK
MTAQVAAQPNSVFSAALAQMNGTGAYGASIPDAENQTDITPFRRLIDTMLGQHTSGDAKTKLEEVFQNVLAEEEQDDLAGELAAILPFLNAFGLTAENGKLPNVENSTSNNISITPANPFGALTAALIGSGNTTATANNAATADLATQDPADILHPFGQFSTPATTTPLATQDPADVLHPFGQFSTPATTTPLVTQDPADAASPLSLLIARAQGEARRNDSGAADLALQLPRESERSYASIQQSVLQQSAPSTAQASASTTSHTLATAVGASSWNNEFANRVVWMANRLESRADLVLTPPQMGRIEVSLLISGEHATASFVSSNPAVREALEAAMPRLREVLADAGIQLGQTQVGAENSKHTAQHEKNGENPSFGRPTRADDSRNMSTEEARTASLSGFTGSGSGRGLVDIFA